MARLTGRRAAAVAVVLALAAGGWWWRKRKLQAAEPGAKPAAVARGDVENRFVDSGEVAPKVGVSVASKASGRIVELYVEEGRKVRRGEKLCLIQPGRSEAEQYVPTLVHAPIDGVVMRVQANPNEEGRIVQPGDYVTGLLESNTPTYLMTVADLSRLIVKMKISEMDILKLQDGMPVTVSVDAVAGSTFPARVSVISPQAERDSNGVKSFKVEIALDRADPRLKPGMTARVDGLLAARRGVLKIPLAAVFEEAGREYALVDEKPKPRRVDVKLGLRSETDAELLEGPKEGEPLLVEKPVESFKTD